ncbi:MAG TPA: C4-type zinc ribbon domain-containing protein [Nitrospirota bacterium]|nr:C4-type zinc ribbon domain-containing protein [Nitrospirota bacterium]
MEERLSLLIQLQEIDSKLRSLAERKNQLPETLASLERRRAESKAELDKTKEALQTAQKDRRDRDKDLEAGAQKVEKLRARTSEIKTNKEYQALLKEIETAEQGNKAVEDEILVLMEKIDAATASITAAEKKARDDEETIMAEQKAHEAAFVKLKEELEEAEHQRQETALRIEPLVLAQYQKLIASKAGIAIAEARGESCSGCYMSIPPQVFVNVKKNNSIITCPHCGRILYYKEAIVQKSS